MSPKGKWISYDTFFEVESSNGIKYRVVLDDYQKSGVQRMEVSKWKDLDVEPSIQIPSGKIKVDGTYLSFSAPRPL